MKSQLEQCESWLLNQYNNVLDIDLESGPARLRWLAADTLTRTTNKDDAHGLVIEDDDIGWLLFLLPYDSSQLEPQVNQALGLRSRLLRESNYTGNIKAGVTEDQDSTWRVGLVWLVEDSEWADWQRHILDVRRESGAAEEISVDAIKVTQNDVSSALEAHGLPRLLLHTRALLSQTVIEAEKWLSADEQVFSELENFSQQFKNPRARSFARELEERVKIIKPAETQQFTLEARQFRRFRVKNFRNLDSMEVVADRTDGNSAQAIILFGPNGTGKSSLAEAISLASFNTSPRLEKFLDDKDLKRSTTQTYLDDYLTPMNLLTNSNAKPCFAWDNGDEYEEAHFNLNTDDDSKRRFDGVVLNQEDSIVFSDMPREKLAAQVLRGYSSLADELSAWLAKEENSVKETKMIFTRKHGLNSSITRSATAYDRLAKALLTAQLQRPSSEFLDWLRFMGRLSREDGMLATKVLADWQNQQTNAVNRLTETMVKLQEIGATESEIASAVHEKLNEFNNLATQSCNFRQKLDDQIITLQEQLDVALTQLESWGVWLASRTDIPKPSGLDSQDLRVEIEKLANARIELEKNGKTLRGRLDLLDQAKQFLAHQWVSQHPDTCPVCDSDVSERQGIEAVVSILQNETNSTIQTLRTRHVEIQVKQKELGLKLKAAGLSICPLAADEQVHLKDLLQPFLPEDKVLEDLLINPQVRAQLKGDLSRMKVLPEAPKPYADSELEAARLASDFIALAQQADKALENPQSIGEVKKVFEQRLENVMKDHLPSTLGKVWQEITMSLTTASWLLPDQPKLQLEQRGKSLSVQTSESGRYIRYIYNAAERHVLGLAWFFTYYLAKRRFEEAWMLLDDPAQEMDQPSFRELVRLWETLLRVHQKKNRPFTMIVALHQEERALDATRATNGQLYILGWRKEQQDSENQSSVKRVVLLAPGYHPLSPEEMFTGD